MSNRVHYNFLHFLCSDSCGWDFPWTGGFLSPAGFGLCSLYWSFPVTVPVTHNTCVSGELGTVCQFTPGVRNRPHVSQVAFCDQTSLSRFMQMNTLCMMSVWKTRNKKVYKEYNQYLWFISLGFSVFIFFSLVWIRSHKVHFNVRCEQDLRHHGCQCHVKTLDNN